MFFFFSDHTIHNDLVLVAVMTGVVAVDPLQPMLIGFNNAKRL